MTVVASAPLDRTRQGRRLPSGKAVSGPVGIVAVVLVWWLLAETVFAASGSVPTPWAILDKVHEDGWDYYWRNIEPTLTSSLKGFLWGNGIALALALLVLLIPPLEGVAVQVAVISYCLPLVAIGPILVVVFGGRTPSMAMAGISCFFTTLVGALLGLRSADAASIDLVQAYGGGRWQQLRRVRIIAAVPATLAALKIAAPAAVLGAILGEYLGGIDTGLGIALTLAQQQQQIARTWGLALAAGILSGLGYIAISLIGRVVAPWSAGQDTGTGR